MPNCSSNSILGLSNCLPLALPHLAADFVLEEPPKTLAQHCTISDHKLTPASKFSS